MHGEDLGARAVTPDPTGEDAAQHSIPAELNGASAGDDVVGRIITQAIRHPAPFGQLGCNAPTNIETKVKTSSAERVRRHRARKKIAAELEELTFVRRDWALFLDPYRLPQKAGCRADQMRALALKELVDNGLDHAANVTLDQIDNDTWSVADDGPGMDRVRIATLFAVDRPLTSTKLLRRPTRGAVGNGLRVVTGAAMASGGSLHVESRGRRFEIKVHLGTGRTEAVETECNAPTGVGTKVTIRFGAALARSPYDGSLARQALRFPGPACEPMRSHLGWYDARSWLELVQAAPAGTPVAQLLAHMGIESTDQRAALDVAFVELAKLELPPEPKLLTRGAGGLEGADYAKAGAAGVLVEAWAMAPARVPRSQGSGTLAVYVNRTPVLVDARISSTDGMHIHGGGFYCRLEKVPATARYRVELSITAPAVPIINDGKTPDLVHFHRAICDAVSVAMRAAEKRLDKPTRKKGAIKEAAWGVMEEAYLKASDNCRLPANARQIMYAARAMVAELIGGEPMRDKYFTQTLLPDYIAAHEGRCADWDVIYDARGHLIEPHTGASVPLGTMAVREYLRPRYRPSGPSVSIGGGGIDYGAEPKHRYKTALFIEKEGFEPLLQKARIRERFDCAILSTKGMSVVACRHLLDRLGRDGTVILVAHDFDRAGLAIAHTIANDGRRYTFEHTPEMIDIGLRLADVEAMDLQDEPAEDEGPTAEKLEEYGATDEEIAVLFGAKRRVELNAMTSRQFLDWLEGKLEEHGAGKVVPPLEMLESKARSAIALRLVSDRIAELEDAARREAAAATLPDDLAGLVGRVLVARPDLAWEDAVARVVGMEVRP